MTNLQITRRQLLEFAGAGAAALLSYPQPAAAAPNRFRFIHMTDTHIQPELHAFEGVTLAVKKILSLSPRPDFILFGGDSVMDANMVDRGRANLVFKLFKEALKPLEIPVHYTLGNHDVYGWNAKQAGSGSEADYGKRMYEEEVGIGSTYKSFDHMGWHFVILDSIQFQKDFGWKAGIDDTQLQWIKSDLEKTDTKKPIIFCTHVPLMTLFSQYTESTTTPNSATTVISNGKEIRDLYAHHNVKAVLQGHTHVVEECIYTGTHYITSGAVCGDWWNGPRLGVHPEGFGVYDIKGNEFSWTYMPYGWHAKG